jgi:starch synthase
VHATFKDGNIYDLSTNEIVANTSEKVIYVADPLGNIHFQPEINKPLVLHHHEILLVDEFPASVSSAGHLTIRDGKITYISNKSGHYHPTKDQFKAFLYKAYNAGILAEDITIRIYNSLYSYQDVEIDFESLNINKILEAYVELPNSNYIDYYDHVDFAGEIDLETFDF